MCGYDLSFSVTSDDAKNFVEIFSGLASVYIAWIVYRLSKKTHEDAQPQFTVSVHRSQISGEDDEIIVANVGNQNIYFRSLIYRYDPDGHGFGHANGVVLNGNGVLRFAPMREKILYISAEAFNGVTYLLKSSPNNLGDHRRFVVDSSKSGSRWTWLERTRLKTLFCFREP